MPNLMVIYMKQHVWAATSDKTLGELLNILKNDAM